MSIPLVACVFGGEVQDGWETLSRKGPDWLIVLIFNLFE